ncbi:sex-determining region Y protein-like [Dermacentor silvarum]|uniref:sex-determining region Y protein-like n=1 Tax=Dermacentor silvarum TaxID=543639 RepID=UPI00189BEEA5|nr:sex-determining region Y protein-like [Dermacentor silvarum]
MAVPDEASHPGVAGASLNSELQHCYQRRSHVPPPPSALMPFSQEISRSVAAVNANEINRRVSSRLAKLWRPLPAADKEPLQRKVAEAVAVHQRKYLDYAHHPREAHRRKEQRERIVKQVTRKLKNDSSWDKEEQPTTCTVAARGRYGLKFQQQLHPPPLPPTPRSTHSAVSGAARVSASGSGQGTVACMPTATLPATTKDPEEQMVPVKVTALRALAEFSKRQSKHFHNYAELTLINIFRTLKQPERQR